MSAVDQLQQVFDDIWSGEFARQYWRERPPMTREEFDAEIALADRMIHRNIEIGDDLGVGMWRESRQQTIDFFKSNPAV